MPPQNQQRQPGMLDRLREFLRPGRGDTIVGNVGEGARDVIIGKNIIKIGTFQVPALPVIITLLAVIGLAAIVAWYAFVPDKMTGAFKIAVADFGQADAQGNLQKSDNGDQLSQWVFDALQTEFAALPSNVRQSLDPQIWHDSIGPLRKRVEIGIVPDNPDAACKRAEELGADILVYGNLQSNQSAANFVPKFCIRQIRRDTDELDDILGNHQLGAPIPLRLPLNLRNDPVARLAVNSKLMTRVNAMSRLTIGLLYDLIGDSNTALGVFQTVNNDLNWDDRDGKEILYYFIGKQQLLLRHIPEARAAFQKAITLNPDYSRAHIGLGTTYYEVAQGIDRPEDRLTSTDLTQAMKEYQQALDLARSQNDKLVEMQAHLALGTGYRLKGEAYLFQNDFAQANQWYELTIQELDKGLAVIPPTQHRLMGNAYLALGAAYQQQAHMAFQSDPPRSRKLFEQARTFYAECIQESDEAPQDQYLADKIKSTACVPYKKDVEQALAQLP